MLFHLNKRSYTVASVLTSNSITIQMQLFPCGAGGRRPSLRLRYSPSPEAVAAFTVLSALSVAVWDRLLMWMGLSWDKTDILAPGLGMAGPLPYLFFIFTLFIRNAEVVMGKSSVCDLYKFINKNLYISHAIFMCILYLRHGSN